MKTDVITLRSVKIDQFIKTLNRSLMLKNNEVLNFSLSSSTISGLANNESESFFKKWTIVTSSIAEFDNEFAPIKVSIYKGDDFIKILQMFNKECSIDIHFIDNEAQLMVVYNDIAKISIVNAPASMSYVEYTDDVLQSIFEPDSKIYEFELKYDDIKRIMSMSSLTTNPEKQTKHVTFYSEDNKLVATDEVFVLKLNSEEFDTDMIDVKVNKPFLKLLCHENMKCEVHNVDGQHILVSKSLESNTISSAVLVESIKESVDDEFDLSNSEFSWDD